ncbi:hypothetical protein IH601_03815 [Candidatus Bipolaricaulota bacterium]|nr:hypothetical protein [Candidatus Bipolaricaulota bacterium]
MDKQSLRPVVFEILKRSPQTHFHAIENDLRKLVESYDKHDVLMLQEVLWELLVQGVLAPGKNSLNLNLPFVHLTEYGAQCLEDGQMLTRDPDHYIARLVETVGRPIDDVVVHSIRASLNTFLSGHWPSALIMLARAAEILFDQLASALIVSQDSSVLAELDALPRFSRTQAAAVIHALQQVSLPSAIEESLEPHLHGLLALVQHSRNQDGSPRWPQPSRDQVLGFFLLLPDQCAFVYHLKDILEGKAVS